MSVINAIKAKRPWEVYAAGVVGYVVLFMNSAEILGSRFDIGELFEIHGSVVYGLIRGIGDDHINYRQAEVFFWFLSVIFVGLWVIKARIISDWLWNEDRA